MKDDVVAQMVLVLPAKLETLFAAEKVAKNRLNLVGSVAFVGKKMNLTVVQDWKPWK